MVVPHDSALARTLILDEIFDLALYRALHELTTGSLKTLLNELIRIEETHVRFWQDFFQSSLTETRRSAPHQTLCTDMDLSTLRCACYPYGFGSYRGVRRP